MRTLRRSLLVGLLIVAAAAVAPADAQIRFGSAVAVAAGEVIVGEPAGGNAFRPGQVLIYRKSGGAWREAARLTSPDAQRADGFGAPLAVAGNTMFVGQGELLHVFRRAAGGAWQAAGRITPVAAQGENFGAAIATAGEWLLVGAPPRAQGGRRGGGGGGRRGGGGQAQAEQPPGAVYLFRRGADGQWTQAGRLTASDASNGDQFGAAIAMADGRALIGAPGRSERTGAAYLFRLNAGGWQQEGDAITAREPQANEMFGDAVAFQGERIVVGTPGSGGGYGAVFVFRHDSETGGWVEQARLAAFSGNRQEGFGSQIATDGSDVWVSVAGRSERAGGANRSPGGAFVFSTPVSAAPAAATFIRPSGSQLDDRFGSALAVDAGIAAIAASGADHGAGTVTIFERAAGGTWRESAEVASDADALAAMTGEERKCSAEGRVGPFACGQAELMAFIPVNSIAIDGRGTRLNDIWGWSDEQTGREYALVGRIDATSFVDITDPSNPIFIGELPKTEGVPDGTWRDIKVYRDHAYIVADGSGAHGMQVFDLAQLRGRNGSPPVRFTPTAHYTRINSSHNIVINEESGFAYAVGASAGGETCGGGLHMIDIRQPANPQFAGCFADPQTGRRGTGYSHDAQCVTYKGPDSDYSGREICLGSNENAMSIADVTDKSNPRAISRAAYPNPSYTHQGWLTEDHRFFFMDDEGDEIAGTTDRTRTMVWDLTDLDDPRLAHEFLGTSGASDHNLYIKGNLMYQSNYRAGLRIIDISDPLRPVEVGFFDTAPYLDDAPGFSGTWSNYPFFKSGAIAVTSVHEGLFLVKKRPSMTVF
jgi:choice-of-anchor B domain-containing protein